MKLYNSNFAPNPRRVRVFLSEKGLSIPRVDVDLAKLEHKTPGYSAVNPFQLIPALELDDGTVIGESIAICRYIEELHPEPNLFGAEPARTRDGRDVATAGRMASACCRSPRFSGTPIRIWRSWKTRRSPTGRPPIDPGCCAA